MTFVAGSEDRGRLAHSAPTRRSLELPPGSRVPSPRDGRHGYTTPLIQAGIGMFESHSIMQAVSCGIEEGSVENGLLVRMVDLLGA
jgi:hypothetical protein